MTAKNTHPTPAANSGSGSGTGRIPGVWKERFKRYGFLAVLLSTAFGGGAVTVGTASADAPREEIGRYQFHPVKNGVWVLDSRSGEVWTIEETRQGYTAKSAWAPSR